MLWKILTKIGFVILLIYLAFDLIIRGINGILHKEIIIYRWTWLLNEFGGSALVLDKTSHKWIDSDERGVRGKKAIFFGFIYIVLGVILLFAIIPIYHL